MGRMGGLDMETLPLVWVVSNQGGISLEDVIRIQNAVQRNATYSAVRMRRNIADHLLKMEYLVPKKQGKKENLQGGLGCKPNRAKVTDCSRCCTGKCRYSFDKHSYVCSH